MSDPAASAALDNEGDEVLHDFVVAYDRALECAAAQHEMTVAQACLLDQIGDPCTMSSVAAELECDASNVTQIVRRLEDRSLVERRQDDNDRRSWVLSRTAAGDKIVAAINQSFAFGFKSLSQLTDDEKRELVRLLRKVLGRPGNPDAKTPESSTITGAGQ